MTTAEVLKIPRNSQRRTTHRAGIRRTMIKAALITSVVAGAVGVEALLAHQASEPDKNPVPQPTEVSPLTPIEQIPVAEGGRIRVTYYDNKLNNFLMEVDDATVVAIDKDQKGHIDAFTVTVPGDNISRNCGMVDGNGKAVLACDISGASLTFKVAQDTAVTENLSDEVSISTPDMQAMLSVNLKLGKTIKYIGAGTGYAAGSTDNLNVLGADLHSLNNLNEKAAQKQPFPRTDKSTTFVAGNISF